MCFSLSLITSYPSSFCCYCFILWDIWWHSRKKRNLKKQVIDQISPEKWAGITSFGSSLQRNNFTSCCESLSVQLKTHVFPPILDTPIVHSGSLESASLSGQMTTWLGPETPSSPFGLLWRDKCYFFFASLSPLLAPVPVSEWQELVPLLVFVGSWACNHSWVNTVTILFWMITFGTSICQEKLLTVVSKMCQGCACGQSRSGCVLQNTAQTPSCGKLWWRLIQT